MVNEVYVDIVGRGELAYIEKEKAYRTNYNVQRLGLLPGGLPKEL